MWTISENNIFQTKIKGYTGYNFWNHNSILQDCSLEKLAKNTVKAFLSQKKTILNQMYRM